MLFANFFKRFDREKMFRQFCDEWVASSAFARLAACGVRSGKDIQLAFSDGTSLDYQVWQMMMATIVGKPKGHDMLGPYSLRALRSGYRRLFAGRMTRAEEREFRESWTEESNAWHDLIDAICSAQPHFHDAARLALSEYNRLLDFTVDFYLGKHPDESIRTIYDLSLTIRVFLGEFIKFEVDRRQAAKNVEKIIVKL